jgi:hypothetical protein
VYREFWLAWWWYAHDLAFWCLLGDGSNEIAVLYNVLMEHRDVLNQLVFLGLHIGESDMSVALTLTYKLNSTTQQIFVACRDAVVAPVLGEAKRRCEIVGYAEGPTSRLAVMINDCSELCGPSFSIGSGIEDLMLLAVGSWQANSQASSLEEVQMLTGLQKCNLAVVEDRRSGKCRKRHVGGGHEMPLQPSWTKSRT